MTIWMICGAMRGVGKTYFSKRLCAILPDSVYAKLGHHKSKPGKSANLFRTVQDLEAFVTRESPTAKHVVLETHSQIVSQHDTIRVFIDADIDSGEVRNDASRLAANADIVVREGVPSRAWKTCLSKKFNCPALVDAICGILKEQLRRNTAGELAARSKVWLINREGQHVFGPGLARLLENVEHLGSLKAATDETDLSYRHMWGEINRAEEELGHKLLIRQPGGAEGGSSFISPEGKKVLILYQRLARRVAAAADTGFSELYSVEDADD